MPAGWPMALIRYLWIRNGRMLGNAGQCWAQDSCWGRYGGVGGMGRCSGVSHIIVYNIQYIHGATNCVSFCCKLQPIFCIILLLLPLKVGFVNLFFDKTICLPILDKLFFSFWEKGNLLFVTLIVCAVMFTQLLIFDVKCRDCLYLGICCFGRQLFHTMIHVVLSIMHYVFTLSWGICLRETYKRSHVFQLVLCVFHSFFSSLISLVSLDK